MLFEGHLKVQVNWPKKRSLFAISCCRFAAGAAKCRRKKNEEKDGNLVVLAFVCRRAIPANDEKKEEALFDSSHAELHHPSLTGSDYSLQNPSNRWNDPYYCIARPLLAAIDWHKMKMTVVRCSACEIFHPFQKEHLPPESDALDGHEDHHGAAPMYPRADLPTW